jgi:hypothetical protein
MSGKWTGPRKWKPLDEAGGPWLIRSHYHGAWHRRSSTGGANGYTTDILQAGVFDFAKAKQYHDPPPYRRDEAIPAARVIKDMEAALLAQARVLSLSS